MTKLTLLVAMLVMAILLFVVPALAGQSAAQAAFEFPQLMSAQVA